MICKKCKVGNHHHDRYTTTGEDAGCPYVVGPEKANCRCWHVNPPPRTLRDTVDGVIKRLEGMGDDNLMMYPPDMREAYRHAAKLLKEELEKQP